ncbi:MAG TPA: hypothetical protein P5016_08570, partial [Verrucomicrobiales bacterium]|nr:hypothetical protein [Verrucomicrobiales bacterium]
MSTARARAVPLSFVEKHCLECHDDLTAEGDFRADLLGQDLSDTPSLRAWSRVLARLQCGEMPPPKKKERPGESEVSAALVA